MHITELIIYLHRLASTLPPKKSDLHELNKLALRAWEAVAPMLKCSYVIAINSPQTMVIIKMIFAVFSVRYVSKTAVHFSRVS